MYEADLSAYAATFVLALLLQPFEHLAGRQCDMEQRRLTPDRRKVARREICQLIQCRAIFHFKRAIELLGLRDKELPALFRLQIVELDFECEAPK